MKSTGPRGPWGGGRIPRPPPLFENFGGFRDEPVGPHPVANVQVIFKPEQFQPVVEWLMLHRDSLDVLVHPLTDNSVDDHSIYAMWLGSPVPLKLNTLRRNYRAELLPSA